MKNEKWNELSPETVARLQAEFLEWYHREKRNLPWRATSDPYAIWISEIMLQQTRVETVIGYYYRFMELFPTIHDLAAADEQKLLKVWEGLGYYSRARNLKIAAQQIVDEYHGEMPKTIEEIRKLKGIGPYTAGAIASIAFSLPEPAIDGNVMRVVSRLFEIDEDITKASSRKTFDEAMRKIISHEEPGEFNQALMDLGSRICTPTSPECAECPLQDFCLAHKDGRQEDFPVKTKKLKPKDVYYVATALENSEGEYLLQQRPASGLLASMWTFPLMEVSETEYQHLLKEWQKKTDDQLSLFVAEESELPEFFDQKVVWQKRHLGEITHIFSHLKWHMLLFYGRTEQKELEENQRFASVNAFNEYVFPKPQQKLVEQLKKNHLSDKDF